MDLDEAKVTDSLEALASYLSCDKRKGDGHGYVKYYTELFESFRDSEVNLLEIGIAKGRSQVMWSFYFQNGTINCLDIDDQAPYFTCRDQNAGKGAMSRIKPVIMDQSDAVALTAYAQKHGPFDIVIDDGSHKPEHQIVSFESLIGYTTKYYVIEDLHPYYAERGHKTVQHFQGIVDRLLNRFGGIKRCGDIDSFPKDHRIESVTFVPNAIIVRLRQ